MANGISSSERDEAQAPYFAWKGRMSRWPLWFGIMGMILVDVVLFVICLIILLATNYGVYLAFVSAALVGNLLILSMFFVKRAHDRGHSGMYALLLIVPFVGVVILFEMLFFKGTRGPNRYGPDSTDIEAFERGSNSIDTSKGRMSRGRFWSVTSGIVVVDIIWLTVGVFFSGGYEGYILFSIFLFIAFNFNLVWFVMLFVKRAHDRDRSAAYVLLLLVPVIGVYVLFELLFFNGTLGPNRYGPDPNGSDIETPNSHSEAEYAMDVKIEEIPALVCLFPEDWADRKSFFTSNDDKIKLSYHYAHHDKKQLAVAALFAMFVEMLRVEEIEFRTRSGLQQEELDVRLIVDKPEGGDGIYGKTVSGLSASRWTGVTAVVADLVSRSVDSLWDAYVELIDEDVDRLSDVEALFSSDDNETEVWDKEMDVWDTVEEMSDIVWEHSWEFATSQPSTFHSLWDGIVSGILYPEQDMKGVTPTRF